MYHRWTESADEYVDTAIAATFSTPCAAISMRVISASNLRRDRQNPMDILDRIDLDAVTEGQCADPQSDAGKTFSALSLPERTAVQERILTDPEKCALTEHRYGPITDKFVLYRGKPQVVHGIQYQNVEEYLCKLPDSVE